MVSPVARSDQRQLRACMQARAPMHAQDGLYFSGVSSPLSLQWKDAACSPYFIDTDANGQPLENQACFDR